MYGFLIRKMFFWKETGKEKKEKKKSTPFKEPTVPLGTFGYFSFEGTWHLSVCILPFPLSDCWGQVLADESCYQLALNLQVIRVPEDFFPHLNYCLF